MTQEYWVINLEPLKSSLRLVGLIACVILLVACATTPPFQEMSDARQAISLAREAGVATRFPELFAEAENFLASAKRRMDKRQFGAARYDARRAREKAIGAMDMLSRNPQQ